MATQKRNVFRILHGFEGLDAVVEKWTAGMDEGKVLFTYLNLEKDSTPEITKIAGTVVEMWTDSEGLVVATQTMDTDAGTELVTLLEDRTLNFTMGPIATYHDEGDKKVLDSLGGIYFCTK